MRYFQINIFFIPYATQFRNKCIVMGCDWHAFYKVNPKGVVSFHGGLAGVNANKDLLVAKILVCHGASDKFVPEKEISFFKHELDSIGADYTFISYPNATHAFTNPDATNTGKQFNMPIEYN